MLEISVIRDQFDQAVAALGKRGMVDARERLQEIVQVDQERRETQSILDQTLAAAKAQAKKIGQLIQSGQHQLAETQKNETTALKTRSKDLQDKLQSLVQQQQDLLYNIPNLPHRNVPEGKSPEDNQVVDQWGDVPSLSDQAAPHWDLIKQYDIIDFELGNKVTGAGFPFYKGKGAKLQRALVSFFLDHATRHGYTEIQPPVLINQESGTATGQLPDKEGQMYGVVDSNLYLIPTAEVPVTNMYRNSVLHPEDIPVKLTGYTPCFRREAGSWGADVRGLNRLHQFDKVEIVQITLPDRSYEALEEMCDYVASLLKQLELPYRVLNLCGGDLGFTAAQTFDFEVFAGAQKKWLEVSSVSNFETYQSNRLKLRCKGEKNNFLLHTLNGSALALPRLVAALLENNQGPDGVRIPASLVPYTGFEKIA